ncbi:MAG: glucose 1-dehydrogenase [Thermoanaerobaculia bacterium]
MKAVAVFPGRAGSVHLREVPEPSLDAIDGGRGVLVEVLRVGVDGTDKEIHAGEYGAAPPGDDYLIVGHESFGRVLAVGPAVWELAPGDFVVATVRRPGASLLDRIGLQDMTPEDSYLERGINLRHGFLCERYVESAEFLIPVPARLAEVGVLLEPASVVVKAIEQAFEIQRRLRVWQPKRALVLGASTLGLLAALFLRLRGLAVVAMAQTLPPSLSSELLAAIGVRYVSGRQSSLSSLVSEVGPFDFILEGTGHSPMVFEAMQALAKNGVLAMVSITGGETRVEVPADRINQAFVLGNKVAFGSVNASRADFESAVAGLAQAELAYPGWLARLLTHPVAGLESFQELVRLLTEVKGAIKVFCEVAPLAEAKPSARASIETVNEPA